MDWSYSSRHHWRPLLRSEQRSAVEYIHLAVGFRGASQHHLIRIDNRVAHDDGSSGRSPVDGDAQRGRRRTGIAGRIGGGGGQAVRAVRQRRRRIGPGPAAVGHALPSRVAPSKTLTVQLASAVPVSVSVVSLVMWSPTVPLSVENEAIVGAAGATVSMVTFMRR